MLMKSVIFVVSRLNAGDRSPVTLFKEISGWGKLQLLSLLLLWLALFAPIYPEMVQDWLSNSDNSHCFIVPIVAGYFAWVRKSQLNLVTIRGSWCGCVVLVLALALYVLSFAGGLAFPARIAMVISLLGLVWCLLGGEAIMIMAFPILFLLFMVPVPYSLMDMVSGRLQLFATIISANLIETCSIPVFREGNMLYFVGTQLEVAEACSGIRSIIALLMLAVAYASMCHAGWKSKTTLILSAIPIAMVANIIRVAGTGILAHFFGDKVARGFLHEFSGIVIFILGFIVFYGVFTLINREARTNA
jgi:exosortase